MRRLPALLLGLLMMAAAPASAQKAESLEAVLALEDVFTSVAERVTPSVVTLEVHGAHEGPFGRSQTPFGGMGSGFIVDADGTIYTNYHVVHAASRIEVILADGSRLKADYIAGDEGSDVAVVRLLEPPPDLPVAPLGDSDGIKVGQFAIAIGAPFGFSSSFTVGHVSAMGRRSIGEGPGGPAPGFERLKYQNFIQVDAPINPGNSGGALVNVHGDVIGINTAIASNSGHGSGVGFSIPINMAVRIANQLLAEGKVTRGWLGVGLEDINTAEAEAFGLTTTAGARVTDVWADSPAARAKLKIEDVVVAFNGADIKSSRDLINAVAEAPIGSALSCRVTRGDGGPEIRTLDLEITLREKPGETELQKMAEDRRKKDEGGPRGAMSWLNRVVGLDIIQAGKRKDGVSVRAVGRGSLASDAELEPGDVLLEVDHKQVASVQDVAEALRGATRPFVPLLVERDGKKKPMSLERPR